MPLLEPEKKKKRRGKEGRRRGGEVVVAAYDVIYNLGEFHRAAVSRKRVLPAGYTFAGRPSCVSGCRQTEMNRTDA